MNNCLLKVAYVQQRYGFDPDSTEEENAAAVEADKERNGYLHAWLADMEDGKAKPFALVEDEEDGTFHHVPEDGIRIVRE